MRLSESFHRAATRLTPLALLLGLAAGAALAQGPTTAPTKEAAPAKSGRPAGAPKPASTGPAWDELSHAQKQALAPLASHWGQLHAAQRRKWISLSGNFDKMSPEERAVLHTRMTGWASLSPQERSRARLNFAEVKRLAPADERKAKWEAYQALAPEEREALARTAAAPPKGAAIPAKPAAQRVVAPVPPADHNGQRTPRIQLSPPVEPTSAPAQSAPVVQKP